MWHLCLMIKRGPLYVSLLSGMGRVGNAGRLVWCSFSGYAKLGPVLPGVDNRWGRKGLVIGFEVLQIMFTCGGVATMAVGTLFNKSFAWFNCLKALIIGVLLHTECADGGFDFTLTFLVLEFLAFGASLGGRKHFSGFEVFVLATTELRTLVLCNTTVHDLLFRDFNTLHLSWVNAWGPNCHMSPVNWYLKAVCLWLPTLLRLWLSFTEYWTGALRTSSAHWLLGVIIWRPLEIVF